MIRIIILVLINSVFYIVCHPPGHSNIGENNLDKEPEPNLRAKAVRVIKKLTTGDIYQGRGVQKHDFKYYNTLDDSDDIKDPVDYDFDYDDMRSPRYYSRKKDGDQKEEGALKAIKRSAVQGLKQFGQGAMGVQAGLEDSEEKSHQSFTGKKQNLENYNSLSFGNSHQNRYRGRTPKRRVRYPLIERDYYDYYDDYDYWRPSSRSVPRMSGGVHNYKGGFKNTVKGAYKGVAKTLGKGVLGIKNKNVPTNDDYDYGLPVDAVKDSEPETDPEPPKKSGSTGKFQKDSFNEQNSYKSKEKNGNKHETLDKHKHIEKITDDSPDEGSIYM